MAQSSPWKTSETLEEGQRSAESADVKNVVFQVGDATRLWFAAGDSPLRDPLLILREMVRVRLNGSVTVIDMVVPSPADSANFNDSIRRDPAHTRALTGEDLGIAVEEAGREVVHTATWENVLDGERWMGGANEPPWV